MEKARPFDERLQQRIRSLEQLKKKELEDFKKELRELREQLSPSNILRNTVHDFVQNPEKRKKLLFGTAGILSAAILTRIAAKKVSGLGKMLASIVLLITRIQKQS